MQEKSSLLGATSHADGEPEMGGAGAGVPVAVSGEGIFRSAVPGFRYATAPFYCQDAGDDDLVVRNGLGHTSSAMEARRGHRADRFRRQGERTGGVWGVPVPQSRFLVDRTPSAGGAGIAAGGGLEIRRSN